MMVTSPNQAGRAGTDCAEVWMWTGEYAILLMLSPVLRNVQNSLIRRHFFYPFHFLSSRCASRGTDVSKTNNAHYPLLSQAAKKNMKQICHLVSIQQPIYMAGRLATWEQRNE